MIDLEESVRANHALRPIKAMVAAERARMDHLYNKAYGPGVPAAAREKGDRP